MPLKGTVENGRTVHFSLALPQTEGLGRGVGYFEDDKMICPKME